MVEDVVGESVDVEEISCSSDEKSVGEEEHQTGGTTAQVEVQFWTSLGEEYETSSDPFLVPTNLARYGLSEVINHLLGRTPDDSRPFEFLIDGEFLRSSLSKYLERKNLTSEQSLLVEYTLARQRPESHIVDKQPDWISKVCWLPSGWLNDFTASSKTSIGGSLGCTAAMDGIVRFYKASDNTVEGVNLIHSIQTAALPLTSAVVWKPQEDELMSNGKSEKSGGGVVEVITCCKSGEVKFCAAKPESQAHAELGRGISHKDSAESVAVSRDGAVVATGGQDGRIALWDNESNLADLASWAASSASTANNKKPSRKRPPSAPVRRPKAFIDDVSAQTITDLKFSRVKTGHLYSASLDKTIRCWDTITASSICVFPVARAATSVDIHPKVPSVVSTTHEDGHVRIWDMRSGDTVEASTSASLTEATANTRLNLRNAYNIHNRWVSEAQWSPFDENLLASTSHDGRVHVVDTRLPKLPIQSLWVEGEEVNEILADEGRKLPVKVMSLCWAGRNSIATGSSDGRLRLHTL